MTKRKLMPFYGERNHVVYVPETLVKTVFKMLESDASKMHIEVGINHVKFVYSTAYSNGEITLHGHRCNK